MPYRENIYNRIIEQYIQDIHTFKKMPNVMQEEEKNLLKELENVVGYLTLKKKLYQTYYNNLSGRDENG